MDKGFSKPKKAKGGKRNFQNIESHIEAQRQNFQNPPEIIIGAAAYAIADKNDRRDRSKPSSVDIDTLQDLGLLSGSAVPIDKRYTVMGEVVINGVLADPTVDIEKLKKRQDIIRGLINFTVLERAILNARLKRMGQSEKHVLSLWEKQVALPGTLNKSYYKVHDLLDSSLNGSSVALTVNYVKSQFNSLLRIAQAGTAAVLSPVYGVCKLGEAASSKFSAEGVAFATPELLEWYVKVFGSSSARGSERIIHIAGLMIPGAVAPAITAFLIGVSNLSLFRIQSAQWLGDLSLEGEAQKKLVAVASYCRDLRKIYEIFEGYPEVSTQLEHYSKLRGFFNDPELRSLLSILDSKTFEEPHEYLFSRGDLLLAWRLLAENEQAQAGFEGALLAVGEIDAYFSIVREFKKPHMGEEVKFCFAEYVTDTQFPVLDIRQGWHPLTKDQEGNVITNSIFFGLQGSSRNGIITGPNGSGKSTFLRTLGFSAVLLPLTYGVGYGSSIKLSPFSYIRSYMNPSDSLENKKSLFQAQAGLISKIDADLERLSSSAFSFLILDEPYTGTNPEEAIALTQATTEAFFGKINNISLIATHHSSVTQLDLPAQEGVAQYKNYRFLFDERKKPTYRMEEGISDVQLGIEVASQQGVSAWITNRAIEIIAARTNLRGK